METHRIQVSPYCPFGRDTRWMTQDIIEGYVFAWIKGEKQAQYYVNKYSQGDEAKAKLFTEILFDDPDFEDLKAQIWDELGLPEPGSIQYHIWQIERKLEDPRLPPSELSKLYKILGEYRGWITKPGEGKASVIINNSNGQNGQTPTIVNEADAERAYFSMIANR